MDNDNYRPGSLSSEISSLYTGSFTNCTPRENRITVKNGEYYIGGEFVNTAPKHHDWVWEVTGNVARLRDRANVTTKTTTQTAILRKAAQTLFSWVNDDSILGALFDMVRETVKGIFTLLERKEVK